MMVFVHPAAKLLRGDESYNSRDLRVMPAGDQMEIVEGVYVDDGVSAGLKPRVPS